MKGAFPPRHDEVPPLNRASHRSLHSADRKVVDVLGTRKQKIKKIDVFTFASLAEAQQDKKIVKTFFRGVPLNHAAKHGKCFHGMLCIVVVPWDTIEIQEREHCVTILLQAIDKFARGFTSAEPV